LTRDWNAYFSGTWQGYYGHNRPLRPDERARTPTQDGMFHIDRVCGHQHETRFRALRCAHRLSRQRLVAA
jgi:hypothetical protein